MLQAVAHKRGSVALLHFDAHLHTWDTYFDARYTYGTPFLRASKKGRKTRDPPLSGADAVYLLSW